MADDSDIAYAIEKLSRFIETDNIMLIGARCRDIHQRKYRDQPAARTTQDIDIALAINAWDDFQAIKSAFPSSTKAWQRIEVDGIPIDLVPFGEVEKPPGEVAGDADHVLNVSGFLQVFEKAEKHRLTSKLTVMLPPIPGFAGLKMHAWLDRWPAGAYKDALDLALILSWYEEDDETLWDRYLSLADDQYIGETDAMAAALLGFDVGQVFGGDETTALIRRFENETTDGLNRFAEQLVAPPEHQHPRDRRTHQVEALLHGLKLSAREQD